MEYADFVAILREQAPNLADEVAGFRTLENVLGWLNRRALSLGSIEVIPQDEYCHDMLIPLDASGRHLVFGMI